MQRDKNRKEKVVQPHKILPPINGQSISFARHFLGLMYTLIRKQQHNETALLFMIITTTVSTLMVNKTLTLHIIRQ